MVVRDIRYHAVDADEFCWIELSGRAQLRKETKKKRLIGSEKFHHFLDGVESSGDEEEGEREIEGCNVDLNDRVAVIIVIP